MPKRLSIRPFSREAIRSSPATARCAPPAWRSPRRFRPRTSSPSRCRTPARPSGTWRTPPGSSRPSLAESAPRAMSRSIRRSAICSTPITKRSGRGIRGPRAACSPGRRLASVLAYRAHVDAAMERLHRPQGTPQAACDLIVLGLAHEEQHQELILMDILSLFAASPLDPVYSAEAPLPAPARAPSADDPVRRRCGDDRAGQGGFAFDNEATPARVAAAPLRLGQPAGHQRRVAGVHGRRRLPPAGVLATPTAGRAVQAEGWERAALLARARRTAGAP